MWPGSWNCVNMSHGWMQSILRDPELSRELGLGVPCDFSLSALSRTGITVLEGLLRYPDNGKSHPMGFHLMVSEVQGSPRLPGVGGSPAQDSWVPCLP